MKGLTALFALLALVGMPSADNFTDLGYREDTVIEGEMGDQCVGVPIHNHDMSFENGYCWSYGGTVPPYYGCFGEAYDVGAVNIECGLYWFTQIGYYQNQPLDAYVWAGGVTAAPSGVLCMIPGITGLDIGWWPTCTLIEIEIGCCVVGEFTLGYWGDFQAESCGWFCCADENGPGGYPWTCIAPGIGQPTGWQHVSVVFSGCVSMGLGATITDDPSPPESRTWGSVKALFE